MTRFALVLGALSAAGPLAIDMYLPALPTIARDLHASQGQAEMSLTAFFIGMTLGQPIYGPLSDRFGRRPPILVGLLLYTVASIVCSLTDTANVLIAARAIQGLGGGVGFAIGAAIVRDLYTGPEATKLLALRMLALGVSPILAPIVGAALITVAPWRSIFWFAAAFGVVCMALMFTIPETNPHHLRANSRLSGATKVYGRLLIDPSFMGPVLVSAFMQVAFFAYIAGSSFVFMTMFGVPPWGYSLIFGVNAIGFIGFAQVVPQLMRRFSAERIIVVTGATQAAVACIMLLAALTHHLTLPFLLPTLFIFLGGFGVVGGPATMLALRDHGAVAGSASALMSFLQTASGAIGTALLASLPGGSGAPLMGVMALGAACSVVCAILAFRRGPAPAPALP